MTTCLLLCESCGTTLPAAFASTLCPNCATLRRADPVTRGKYFPDEAGPAREGTAGAVPGHDLHELIGEGGMGEVLRARQGSLDRDVAVKIIAKHRQDAEHRDRFLREARFLAQLDHPNIVPIYDYGCDAEGRCFYTMKLVRGRTLKEIITAVRKGAESWTVERRLEVFRKVCDGMAFAHSRGVIHRDLKPENIMVGEFGEVLVMDWGLAGELSNGEPVEAPAECAPLCRVPERRIESDVSLTLEGAVIGTPQYMAPEQANACLDLDARCDIYALGGVLYSLMTLLPPLRKAEVNVMLENVRAGRIAPFQPELEIVEDERTQRRMPAGLAAIIRKAMAREREERFFTVRALARDVDAYLSGFATSSEEINLAGHFWLLVKRHRSTAAAAALLLVSTAVLLVTLMTSERRATQSAFLAERNAEVARKSAADARITLAQANIALADSAYAANETVQMREALNAVPVDLRDSAWDYLNARTDDRQSLLSRDGDSFLVGSAPHPTRPSVFSAATSGDTHRIVDFDATSGEVLTEFEHRGGWVRSIAYSPDHSRIALGRIMGEGISIHRADTGAEVMHWKAGWVDHVAFHPDGKRLFQSDHIGCTMWDSTTGRAIWTSDNGMTHYLMPAGDRVVSIGTDTVALLSADDGRLLASFPVKPVFPITASLKPDGQSIIVAHPDGEVSGYRLSDGSQIFQTPAGSIGAIERTAFTPDGKWFITVAAIRDSTQSVQLRDATTGRPLRPLRGGVGGIESVCLHPLSSDLLVTGSRSATWSLPQYREPSWRLPANPMHSGFVTNDDLFLAPTESGEIGAVDVRSGSTIWRPSHGRIGTAATSVDGKTGIAQMPGLRGERRLFLIFRALDGGIKEIAETDYGTDAFALAVNRNGTRVALSGSWGSVSTRLTATGEKLPKPDTSDIGFTLGLAWHGSDSKKLVGVFNRFGRRGMAGAQEWLVAWNTDTGERIAAERSTTPMNCLASEPGGDRLVEAGDDKMVRIRDANTLAMLRKFRAHDGPINAIAWHPHRAVVATGSADRTIRLWDLESGSLMEELHVNLREPQALYFSPSGNRMACAIPGDKTLIWDLSDLFAGPLPPVARLANRR